MIPALCPMPPYVVPTTMIDVLTHLGLLTNLKLCLDAGDFNSYSGSGQTWSDLSGGGYNFNRGSGSGSDAADPTFNGTAGKQSSGEYWSYDGGDYFSLAQSNPSWVNAFHKSGAVLSIVEWIYLNNFSTLAKQSALGDVGDTSGAFQVGTSTGSLLHFGFGVFNDSGVAYTKTSTGTLNNDAWNMLAVSVDITAGIVLLSANGAIETYTSQSYSSPSSGDATSLLNLGRMGSAAGSPTENSGDRSAAVAMWSAALSGVQITALYNATKGKFGL